MSTMQQPHRIHIEVFVEQVLCNCGGSIWQLQISNQHQQKDSYASNVFKVKTMSRHRCVLDVVIYIYMYFICSIYHVFVVKHVFAEAKFSFGHRLLPVSAQTKLYACI